MKRYKLIKNINKENEDISYFDRLSLNRAKEINGAKSYVLLSFDSFLKKYMPCGYKCTRKQKVYFNNNVEKYCYE